METTFESTLESTFRIYYSETLAKRRFIQRFLHQMASRFFVCSHCRLEGRSLVYGPKWFIISIIQYKNNFSVLGSGNVSHDVIHIQPSRSTLPSDGGTSIIREWLVRDCITYFREIESQIAAKVAPIQTVG